MANDGQIVFEVTADGKHAIADIKEITRAIQQESSKWDDAAKKSADGINDKFSGMLKKLVAGFSAVKVGKALLDIGQDAIQAASDLEEVQNVVDVTFGDGAAIIESWAKKAGSQFGLTETQAKRFSSTMGAMLKSAGLAGNQIVDVSTDLAGLAADMASFYNLDFDTAFQKIRSGISGETEPLKQLGINMSVANLNAFALQQGLSKTFEQMTQGEQTMLRYQYMMQATSDAQGDFSRTSDGYANSMRKLQTNIDTIKTALGKTFIAAVTDASGVLNSFLEKLLPDESKRTVLDDFADIDLKTQDKIAQIEEIKAKADELTGVLDTLFGRNDREGDTQGEEASEVLSKYGVKSEEARKYLQSLGLSTEEINTKQETWLETCKRLVKTIPGLSALINTETGEVKGGTQAVRDYVQAWEEGQKKLAMLGALEEKENALSQRFSDLPGLELDMAVAERRVRQNYDQLEKLYEKYGLELGFNQDGSVYRDFGRVYGLTQEQKDELNRETDYYERLVKNAEDARAAYENQSKALDEAKKALKEYRQTIDEMPDGIDAAKDATAEWSDEAKANAQTIITSVQDALKALEDYANGVRESVAKSIDATVKGFGKIETSSSKMTDLTSRMSNMKTGSDEWEKLNEELSKLKGNAYSAQNIAANLQQQAQYMDDYLRYLNEARSKGISDDVLAELADGSTESFDVLKALSEASGDATKGEVKAINDAYQSVIDKKKQMTEELSNQQLTVDKTYQSLAEKAKEAVAALDLEGEAAENSGKTIAGLAKGISGHVPEVQAAVDSIIAQLDRLNGFGIDIDLGGFGEIKFTTATGKTEGSSRMGLDYVPHDDYIARLHEGEKVLTAQEASIYRGLANGALAGVDLDSLGGVMRDNIKPGGNVYLDGKVVGSVISEQQGRSYKSLQRSGWQS